MNSNTSNLKNATPEQKIVWEAMFGGAAAWNTITPIFYQAPILGSEFLVYDVDKAYVALQLEFTNAIVPSGVGAVIFRGNGDVIMFQAFNNYLEDHATAQYFANDLVKLNTYFYRIVVIGYTYIKFIGYRLEVI